MKKSILITLGIVLSQGLSEAATGGYGYDDYEDRMARLSLRAMNDQARAMNRQAKIEEDRLAFDKAQAAKTAKQEREQRAREQTDREDAARQRQAKQDREQAEREEKRQHQENLSIVKAFAQRLESASHNPVAWCSTDKWDDFNWTMVDRIQNNKPFGTKIVEEALKRDQIINQALGILKRDTEQPGGWNDAKTKPIAMEAVRKGVLDYPYAQQVVKGERENEISRAKCAQLDIEVYLLGRRIDPKGNPRVMERIRNEHMTLAQVKKRW